MSKEFIPVMLTPFKESGEIDFDGLKQLTEYYISAGAKGLFANCLSSEMYELSEGERLSLISEVLRIADGRVPVVATGTFGKDLNYHAEFIRQVHALGVEAVIVITSLLADEDEPDKMLNQRVFELLDCTGEIPLGFYECPKPYKRLLSAEQLAGFVATGRIKYHKDTCLDLSQVEAKVAACSGYDFGLYDAYMVNAISSLKAGAAGLSCIQGNYFPALVSWICENYDNQNLSFELSQAEEFFVKNMDLMHDYYPFSAKYCLQKQGLKISTTVRNAGPAAGSVVLNSLDQLLLDYQKIAGLLSLEVLD